MKAPDKKPKRLAPAKKLLTFDVGCTFNLTFTFNQSEIEPDPDGSDGDFEPTEKAMRLLEKELSEYIGFNYVINNFEAFTESENIREAWTSSPSPKTKAKKKKGKL